ncbi:glycoside hydrolase family 5 protein [Bradyrhizobium sp. 2TAF24]
MVLSLLYMVFVAFVLPWIGRARRACFRRRGAVVIAAIMAVVSGSEVRGDAAAFSRGVGVHRPLNWASVSPADPMLYLWPPFATADHAVSDSLIGRLRSGGFDFVRLTVDPGPFLQMTGRRRQELDVVLRDTIRRFRGHGLGVLVNFHGNSQVAAVRPEVVFRDSTAPLFTAYVAMVGQTARLLAELKDPGVALEPVNEPPAGYDDETAARWQSMMEALYRAARGQAPELLIVVTGAQGGSRRGLMRLDPAPFRDGNVLYSFHYYEPHILTHQGVESHEPEDTEIWRYLQGLPFPASSGDRAGAVVAVQRRIAADTTLAGGERQRLSGIAERAVGAYFSEDWSDTSIHAAFDEVAAWAARHAVDPHRILLGEFGATRIAAPNPPHDAMRASWLRDVRCAAERRRFRWAIWELNGGGGMAIVDPLAPERLDGATLVALGLFPGLGCRL